MAYRDGNADRIGVGETMDEAIQDLLDQEMPQTIEKSPEELRSELADRVIETHHAKFDYFGFTVAIEEWPWQMSYDGAVKNGEWEALREFHHNESNHFKGQGDMESAGMHLVLSAAFKERMLA